jgi:hypothetical protein
MACTSSSTRRVDTPPIPFASGLEPVATRWLTLDHGHQCLLRGLPCLEKAREVAALPQLRHPQVQRAQTGIESALSIPVAPRRAVAAAFMPASADQALDIGLHDQLKDGLGDAAKEVSLIVLGQQLGQVHVGLGHRGRHAEQVWRCRPFRDETRHWRISGNQAPGASR